LRITGVVGRKVRYIITVEDGWDVWGYVGVCADRSVDETRISYLAFKGDFMKLNKEAVSVLYEAAANPTDHKSIVGIGQGVGRSVQ
jgi:hypothetical protein